MTEVRTTGECFSIRALTAPVVAAVYDVTRFGDAHPAGNEMFVQL